MKSGWKQPHSLGDVLKKALDRWKLTQPMRRYEVLEQWESIAGPQIAERSRPLKVQGENLIIEVDHPAWVQELTLLKTHLLKKISKNHPKSKIKNIRFVLR